MKRTSPLSPLLFFLFSACFLSCNNPGTVTGSKTASAPDYHDQVQIHSHNDYDHAVPFRDAYYHHAAEIEADVFVPTTPEMKDSLMIGHKPEDITPGRTLISMYIDPIVSLFKKYQNKPSADPDYTFRLMIDVKNEWKDVYPLLLKEISKYPSVFDRKVNPMAVQVFASGNWPPDSTFHTYPSVINFDGLPAHNYAPADLAKVVLISDDFSLYSKWTGQGELPAKDRNGIKKAIDAAHAIGKPFRMWGTPDTSNVWEQLRLTGADVINTDKIADCTQYFANFYK